MKKALLSVILLIFLYSSSFTQTIRYITETGAGSKDGSSWLNAYDNTQLQAAINESGVEEVWVAAGTYKPNSFPNGGSTEREKHFSLKNGVAVYGGFAGGESLLSARNWEDHETILSGDIGVADVNTDNCYYIFYHPNTGLLNLNSTAVIDGFTITKGNGGDGAGMHNEVSSPTVRNCIFTENSAGAGGGIYNFVSSPTISKCSFINNTAIQGGGIYNTTSCNPTITNCIFDGNSVTTGGGIEIYDDCDHTITNCLFINNTASSVGGGIYIRSSCNPTITNCTFSKNTAGTGGGMYHQGGWVKIYNSIIWDNISTGTIDEMYLGAGTTTTIDNCCYPNGTSDFSSNGTLYENNNIHSNPKFILSGDYPYAILGNSPCVNYGTNIYNSESYDIRDRDRIQNTTIDIGAYEWTSGIDPATTIYYVKENAVGLNNGTSWANAFTELHSALFISASGDQIWVAAGTYKPSGYFNGGSTDREKHFSMKNEVEIYGGFDGTESLLSERDWVTNETFLSGDIGTVGDISDNCYHVFYHPNGTSLDNTAIIDGFIITKGYSDELSGANSSGGGMYNDHCSPSISNCAFISNRAPSNSGGAIYNNSFCDVELSNCTFQLNYANKGGAFYSNSFCSPTFSYCFFHDNSGYNGGAVYKDGGNPVFTDCEFTENTADAYGGGMYSKSSGSPVLTDCLFEENQASEKGGGIYFSTSSGSITNCTFNNNLASSGGGIANVHSNPSITSCTFSGNSAFNYSGGGLDNYDSSTPTIKNCKFSNNSAALGGGVSNIGSSPNYLNCLIVNNSAVITLGQNGNGGGIFSDISNAVFTNCTITGNSAVNGGCIYSRDVSGATNCVFNNSIIWLNTASNDGNQIYVDWQSTITLNYSCYSNSSNDVNSSSGTFIATNHNITLDPCFTGNINNPQLIYGISPCVNSGNNDYNAESLDFRGQARIQNTTIDMGAYEWTEGVDPLRHIIYVKYNATGANNGTNWTDAYTSLHTAISNSASNDEIWVAAGTYKPSGFFNGGSEDREKHFSLKNGVSIYGGFNGTESLLSQRNWETNGTILNGDIGTFDDISDNCYHIFYHPNGTALNNTALLSGFTITKGNANTMAGNNGNGGGMYNDGCSPTISYCTFDENTAQIYGGGIYNNSNSSPIITNCIFDRNTSSNSGGAMYNLLGSNVEITNSTFSENTTTYNGGAIANNESNPILTNCLIEGNTSNAVANNFGGGINNYNNNSVITNCTITGNCAYVGGGIYNDNVSGSTTTVNNSIICSNTGEDNANEIYIGSGSTVTLNYTCYSSGAKNITNDGIFNDSNNNISDNPCFFGSGDYPYLITQLSPCRNTGNDTYNSKTTDIRELPRKEGTIDMGAYEYQTGVDPLPVELTSFTASTNGSNVVLHWQTATEVNNHGFQIERKSFDAEASSLGHSADYKWQNVGFVEGYGNSNSIKEYNFTDKSINGGGKFQYRLKQIDTDGSYSYSEIVEVTVIPTQFELSQNYPNPFNPSTSIKYQVSSIESVSLKVYDILGNEVATLVNERKEPGYYEVEFNASHLTSGVYFYVLRAGDKFNSVKKMMLIK